MSSETKLDKMWAAYSSLVNWQIPHYLDIERLNNFFCEAHMQGKRVGQDLISDYFPEPDESDPNYKYWERLVSKADSAGELLIAYDKYRVEK